MVVDTRAMDSSFREQSTCLGCLRRCDLQSRAAFCGAYLRHPHGGIENLAWGQVLHQQVEPIEKKPVFHFRPGTRVLSLGTWGCSFRCRGCLNHKLAWRTDLPGAAELETGDQLEVLTPEQVVERALASDCQGLAWTYNEAAIWLPFVQATNRLAQAAGLYTVLVTNGAYPLETVELLAPYLDVWRVDIKAWEPAAYHQWMGFSGDPAEILAATARAQQQGVHVEVVTCLTPRLHQQWTDLQPLADWILQTLGPETPWHLVKFHPQHQLRHLPGFSQARAQDFAQAARDQGLSHVYIGGNGYHAAQTGFEADSRQRVYTWYGPAGEFLRLTLDLKTGKIGFVGDDSLLVQVLEKCRAKGLPLAPDAISRCG